MYDFLSFYQLLNTDLYSDQFYLDSLKEFLKPFVFSNEKFLLLWFQYIDISRI